MSVHALEGVTPAAPASRVRETVRPAESPAAPAQDRAVLSEEARILAARLEAAEKANKLHLSPKELAALVQGTESPRHGGQ